MIGLRTSHGKIDSHLSTLRKLASETAIYGVSSIVGRFLNYLLVPLYTYHFSPAEYGVVSEFVMRVSKNRLRHREVDVKTIYNEKDIGMTKLDALKSVAQMIKWRIRA